VIASRDDRQRLEIRVTGDGLSDDRWIVRLEPPDLQATHEFWSGIEAAQPVRWFETLAGDWRGWDGVRERRSVEHDFKLAATHDGLGHIGLWITLGTIVAPEANTWLVRVPFTFEAGQLDELVAGVRPLS
jgi:hypothetical protein